MWLLRRADYKAGSQLWLAASVRACNVDTHQPESFGQRLDAKRIIQVTGCGRINAEDSVPEHPLSTDHRLPLVDCMPMTKRKINISQRDIMTGSLCPFCSPAPGAMQVLGWMRRRLGASSWKCKPQLLHACVHAVAIVNNTLAYLNTQLGGLQTARIAGRDAAPAPNQTHSKGGLAGTPAQVVQRACLPHSQLVALPAGRTHFTSHQRLIRQSMQPRAQ